VHNSISDTLRDCHLGNESLLRVEGELTLPSVCDDLLRGPRFCRASENGGRFTTPGKVPSPVSTTLGHGPLCPNKWTVLKENDRDASSLKRAGYRALLNLSRSKILNDGTDAKELKVVTVDVITDIDTARHVAT
jgi:hypothetical protein